MITRTANKYDIYDTVIIPCTEMGKRTCPICDGKGYITVKEERFNCPKCNGDTYLKDVKLPSEEEFLITHLRVTLDNRNNEEWEYGTLEQDRYGGLYVKWINENKIIRIK